MPTAPRTSTPARPRATPAAAPAPAKRARAKPGRRRRRPARALQRQARLHDHVRAGAGARAGRQAAVVRDPEARRHAAALRLPARARRRAAVLGRAQGPQLRSEGAAAGRARRGPPGGLRHLRRHHPEGPVRRGHRDRVGQRHLGAGGRSARRHEGRQARVPAARQEAGGAVGAGEDRQARRAPGALAAVQEARRMGAAACRLRRRQRAARQRRRASAEPLDGGPARDPARADGAATLAAGEARRRAADADEVGARGAQAKAATSAFDASTLEGARKAALPADAVAAARDAGQVGADARRLALRDQVRRLPPDDAHRQGQGRRSSRAAATTGRTRCSRSPTSSRRWASTAAGSTARPWCWTPTACRTSTCCRTRSTRSAAARPSSTTCSTRRSSTATTCATCRCTRAARCSSR